MPRNTTATAGDAAPHTADFGDITFKDAGTYVFTITETHAGETIDGVTYAADPVTVMYAVGKENGVLSVTGTTYTPENRTFTNVYSASGSLELTAKKALAGRTLEDGAFSFLLEGNGENQEKSNVGETVTFDALAYDESDIGKTYTYTVKEKIPNPEPAGYTYDRSEYAVKVSVDVDPDDASKLIATPSITKVKDADGTAIASEEQTAIETMSFSNLYEAEGQAELSAKKAENAALGAREFSFMLTDAGGTEIGTKTGITQGGTAVFAAIRYTLDDVGEHTYRILEVIPDDAVNADGRTYAESKENSAITGPWTKEGVEYDSTVHTITVTVSDAGNGTLEVLYGGEGTFIVPEFVNGYDAEGEAVFHGTKSIEGRHFREGDRFTVKVIGTDHAPMPGTTAAGSEYTKEFTLTAEDAAANGTGYEYALDSIRYSLSDIPSGELFKVFTYTVTESAQTMEGIAATDDTVYTVTVKISDNGDGTLAVEKSADCDSLDFMNEQIHEIHLLKVNRNNHDTKLPGATFQLKRLDGDAYSDYGDPKITPDSGRLTWSGLPVGDYEIVETEAPDGYDKLTKPIRFSIDPVTGGITPDSGNDDSFVTWQPSAFTFVVENKPGALLPMTGGPGTAGIRAIGAMLALAALALLLKRRRSAKE